MQSSDQVIAVIGNGEMGSAVAQVLVRAGARVLTSLRGRGEASRARAQAAGAHAIDDDWELVSQADVMLSVVPPGQARAVAERFVGPLRRKGAPTLYADCNAIAPASARAIGELVTGSGASFVDASIIGPPRFDRAHRGYARIFASGDGVGQLAALGARYGVDVVAMEGPPGAASAIKMCYAGLTKGLTALGAAVSVAAARYQVEGMLEAELERSAQGILHHLQSTIPAVPRKAYRFVAEMEEIAQTMEQAHTGATIYDGMAQLYEFVARASSDPKAAKLVELLQTFLRQS
ncbi:MAG TPA: DUF1932 domain-containing protein [Candidatus Binataceae bacterium]|nr:DUF1932 domain-containing protein [Candidatus Binataceae bacterium]